MNLSILKKDGQNIPIFVCDTCSQPIEDTREGIVIYPLYVDDGYHEAKAFHKGDCDRHKEREPTSEGEGSIDLARYIAELLANNHWGRVTRSTEGEVVSLPLPEPLEL